MSDSSAISAITNQALKLAKATQFEAALKKLDELGSQLTSNAEACYIKAVCLRKVKQVDGALQMLEQTLNLDPSYARAHQEAGHILLAAGKLTPATKAYERAVETDSALVTSWRPLVTLYAKIGEAKKEEMAKHEVAQLEQLSPTLRAVKSNLNRDDLETADLLCREHLKNNKDDIEGMRLLAEIANRAKIHDDAEFILESAVAFAPTHIGARFDYANVLVKRQKFGKAHEIAQALFNEQPHNVQFKSQLASTLVGVGETEQGAAVYRELIGEGKEHQLAYLLLGHAEKTMGNLAAAIESYQKLYDYKPDFGDAFWSLANTKTYTFTDAEVTHMEDYKERAETAVVDKVHFNFALGKAYEDKGDYERAFAAYNEGNTLNKGVVKYSAEETSKRMQRQMSICNGDLFKSLEKVGSSHPDPIFIVGLPRAGSTLLEQILASHSQVDGTLELPNILSLSKRLQGRVTVAEGEEPQYPKILGELEHDYFKRFGEQFIEDTQVFRQGAPFFIDKMPNNFLHLGLIKLILPNAKIIDARRHPMACCFSGFKQLFAEGQEFTYGLTEIGNYYKEYIKLMDHWDEVLPDFVLRVQHEEVVEDLETQVRRMLEFCNLPFEESCLEFYKTERNVRTPSSEQVRQPIYKTGLEQWRNFEQHLTPLIDALGPDVLRRYPIS